MTPDALDANACNQRDPDLASSQIDCKQLDQGLRDEINSSRIQAHMKGRILMSLGGPTLMEAPFSELAGSIIC